MVESSETNVKNIYMFHIVDDDLTIGEILSELISEFGNDTVLFHYPDKYLKHI